MREELKQFILTVGSFPSRNSCSPPASHCSEGSSDVLCPCRSSEENSSVIFQIQLLGVSEHWLYSGCSCFWGRLPHQFHLTAGVQKSLYFQEISCRVIALESWYVGSLGTSWPSCGHYQVTKQMLDIAWEFWATYTMQKIKIVLLLWQPRTSAGCCVRTSTGLFIHV